MSHGNHQERLNESLSALMDGEATELELQRVLKASEGGEEIGERWTRYQLAASVMRRESVSAVDTDLAARISAAIDAEPALNESAEGSSVDHSATDNRWWRSLSRGAVAATVAFAAILGVQQFSGSQAGPELVAGTEPAAVAPKPVVQSTPRPSGFYVPAPSTRAVSTAPRMVLERQIGVPMRQPPAELMEHLNRVMIQHSEQAAHLGNQGMVPFVRATYGEQNGQ